MHPATIQTIRIATIDPHLLRWHAGAVMVLDPGVKSQGSDVDADSEGPVLQWETLRMPGWWHFLLDFRENCNSFMGIKIYKNQDSDDSGQVRGSDVVLI